DGRLPAAGDGRRHVQIYSVTVVFNPMDNVQAARSGALGFLIVAIIVVLLGVEVYGRRAGADPNLLGALRWGVMAAVATTLGTLPVIFSLRFSQRVHDTMLGFGAGVMLAASSFSLILPALESARTQGAGPWEA